MTGQLGFEGMPRRLFACTPSKIAAFDECPRRYKMTYVDRPTPPRGPAWAHNTMGAAVHAALRQWWDLDPRRRTPTAARALLSAAWNDEGFRDAEQSAEWRDRSAGWVERYVATLDPDDDPIGVERFVAATTAVLALSGRADRIDDRDGELVIVDYKTGRHACTVDDARSSPALAFYVLGARRTFHRDCHRVELHHLPTGSVASWTHTEESLRRQIGRAEASADDIVLATDTLAAGADAAEVFPPRPGPSCGWCDFRQHCPEGRQASTARAPWAALDNRPDEAANPGAGSGAAGLPDDELGDE